MINHPIQPVYDKSSRILILGSFPSVKSRENMFFYGHPQNRFWKVLAEIFEYPLPKTIEEKRSLLLSSRIALWDVIATCEITGSSDTSIKNVIPNDLSQILNCASIEKIYLNGKTAEKYYNRFLRDTINIEAICLPSTSPANAIYSLDKLLESWRVIGFSQK